MTASQWFHDSDGVRVTPPSVTGPTWDLTQHCPLCDRPLAVQMDGPEWVLIYGGLFIEGGQPIRHYPCVHPEELPRG